MKIIPENIMKWFVSQIPLDWWNTINCLTKLPKNPHFDLISRKKIVKTFWFLLYILEINFWNRLSDLKNAQLGGRNYAQICMEIACISLWITSLLPEIWLLPLFALSMLGLKSDWFILNLHLIARFRFLGVWRPTNHFPFAWDLIAPSVFPFDAWFAIWLAYTEFTPSY